MDTSWQTGCGCKALKEECVRSRHGQSGSSDFPTLAGAVQQHAAVLVESQQAAQQHPLGTGLSARLQGAANAAFGALSQQYNAQTECCD